MRSDHRSVRCVRVRTCEVPRLPSASTTLWPGVNNVGVRTASIRVAWTTRPKCTMIAIIILLRHVLRRPVAIGPAAVAEYNHPTAVRGKLLVKNCKKKIVKNHQFWKNHFLIGNYCIYVQDIFWNRIEKFSNIFEW